MSTLTLENQIRQNRITGEWVIFAPSRGDRPKDFKPPEPQHRYKDLPEIDDDCPFCPGNSDRLTEIILEHSEPAASSWQTRVVPNKYPALEPGTNTDRFADGLYRVMPGYGHHEVIIEHAHHNQDLTRMSHEEVGQVIETYHQRYTDLMRDRLDQNLLTLIFRNHGQRAGTSLLHPHSQLVAIGIVPRYVRWREYEAQRYFDEWGRCAMCDILYFEERHNSRIVERNDSFLAFVPYAAEVPYETWIVPRRHQADFGSINDSEKADFAQILQDMLCRLYTRLNDPDYNYIINSAARYKSGEPHLHWYLRIMPRITTPAGFEIGSGIRINPTLPEENVEDLKA